MRTYTRNGREYATYTDADKRLCQECGALAVVPLTPRQLCEQTDNTTHVCHPALGGCNQGYDVVMEH